EKRTVTILRRTKFRDVFREELDVIAIDLRHVLDDRRNIVVMRKRMMGFRHPDLRIWPRALFFADHERDDSREVRLKCQKLEVQHQGEMVLEYRRNTLGCIHGRQRDVTLFFRSLNAAFNVANGIGIFVDLALVLWPELALKTRKLVVH